jgi:hypothetical protein
LALFDLFTHCLHLLFGGFAKDSYLLQELTSFGLSREQRPESNELSEDTSDGPDVNLVGVIRTGQDKLRGSVVPTDDVRGVLPTLSKNFGATEVTDLDDALFSFENVLGLQVSMADLVAMYIGHSFEDLTHVVSDLLHGDGLVLSLVILDDVFQVG